ncbi:DUF6624 domain-containing protein [Prolixibacter denitrificans]|uniref:Uncharacterized protein n=1 Tax=Prolixibacter denitrificans TaxID=1541063 RepID=A0A2P8C9Q5_9BACT|nr:DUF6624 domain-containing protein [Prolixibacter denitrificans]PSK81709.1 hypothetical protein CLV93_108107 [Prolixibacter denitrificans]GET21231.1 hypothetical protein JCM18694_14770 [Prolixibacter denitrificans]
MKKLITLSLTLFLLQAAFGQNNTSTADSLKREGLLMPSLMKYGETMVQHPSAEISYKIASTTALLWTTQMRDTTFYFLNIALQNDSTLEPLYNPDFLSIIDDPRWKKVEDAQFEKYEAKHGPIKNKPFARELFRMIIKDQGMMYAGNIERKKYMKNGGYFSTPAIFPVLAMEEKNKKENEERLPELLSQYGWPTASAVTEVAAAGAALIINHASHELRAKYFPMLEKAFKNGEAQPLRYAKMCDRLLVEEGKEQLYGTQVRFDHMVRVPYPIKEPENVDKRRAEIGLGPLKPYLKARFNIDWPVAEKE